MNAVHEIIATTTPGQAKLLVISLIALAISIVHHFATKDSA